MIIDVPTRADFENIGTGFLALAWDFTAKLALEIDDFNIDWDDPDPQVIQYRSAAQKPLATALALTQQATEFLLKGRIAEISPYLLLAGSSRDWPNGCDRNDILFSDFKTIEAHELIRVHDTVSPVRLSPDFKERFESLRRLRNSVMHTVTRNLPYTVQDMLLSILDISYELVGPGRWVGLRRESVRREPASVMADDDYSLHIVASELLVLIKMLKPFELRKHFGFEKRQRTYLCPHCDDRCRDWEMNVALAQLRPNMPDSTRLYCIACEREYSVDRQDCGFEGCKGNVIEVEYNKCLTCGHEKSERKPLLTEFPPRTPPASRTPGPSPPTV